MVDSWKESSSETEPALEGLLSNAGDSGVVIPALALVLIAWLLASSSWSETRDVIIAVAVGAVLLAVAKVRRAPAV